MAAMGLEAIAKTCSEQFNFDFHCDAWKPAHPWLAPSWNRLMTTAFAPRRRALFDAKNDSARQHAKTLRRVVCAHHKQSRVPLRATSGCASSVDPVVNTFEKSLHHLLCRSHWRLPEECRGLHKTTRHAPSKAAVHHLAVVKAKKVPNKSQRSCSRTQRPHVRVFLRCEQDALQLDPPPHHPKRKRRRQQHHLKRREVECSTAQKEGNHYFTSSYFTLHCSVVLYLTVIYLKLILLSNTE